VRIELRWKPLKTACYFGRLARGWRAERKNRGDLAEAVHAAIRTRWASSLIDHRPRTIYEKASKAPEAHRPPRWLIPNLWP
jgi:hypothetical protein